MKTLLGVAAVLELVTGLALMIAPAAVAQLLLGTGISGAGIAVGRLAGLALLSLGLACWPGRERARDTGPALLAMLTYNPLVTIYLIRLGVGKNLVGILLWPAVAIHAVLTLLLATAWFRERPSKVGTE
jgi:hypothetical protein